METLSISARAAAGLRRNNLWIFSNEIRVPKTAKSMPGSWCHFEHGGRVVGTGYYNPHSLIAGRILTRDKTEDRRSLLEARVEAAFERRRSLIDVGSCRLIFSEADLIPGLIFDLYGSIGVIQTSTAGIDSVLPDLLEIVPAMFKTVFGRSLQALIVRADASIRTLEGIELYSKIVFGEEGKLTNGALVESNVHFGADFVHGQKTGFFLDQRDNRGYLKRADFCSGARVLDVFCYSGGWGLSALKGGAAHVTFVDESAPALSLVEKGLSLNNFSAAQARLAASEAFEFLEKDQNSYDVVIIDPPAFVKSKKVLPQAMKAYEKCNRLALRRLKPGGILLTSCCSYHLSTADFSTLVSDAFGKDEVAAHVVYQGTQAADHPILLSMPETRYLKCLGLKKI